ncbi:copper resistance protein NlpE N-terminal domain-containing protein [Verticiella sediminum]|nr:copper resistance protein NlpE N-terminal domain-containing protein [Verticiella sediminum]
MPALLSGKSRIARVLAGAMSLATLAACQYYAPNAYVDPDSTEAVTRAQAERLQQSGASRSMAPSQIRIATGGLTQPQAGVCRDWLDPCWEQGAGQVQSADTPEALRIPRPAEAQTFRGVLPCQDAAMGCQGQRAVLTLFANGTWRANVSYLDGAGRASAPTQQQGCWTRGFDNPRQLLLTLANGNPLAEFNATSVNSLLVRSPEDSPTALRYTLTRQPDPELMGGAPQGLRCPV